MAKNPETGSVQQILTIVSEIKEIVLKIERTIQQPCSSNQDVKLIEIEKFLQSSKENKSIPTYRPPKEWDLSNLFNQNKQKRLSEEK